MSDEAPAQQHGDIVPGTALSIAVRRTPETVRVVDIIRNRAASGNPSVLRAGSNVVRAYGAFTDLRHLAAGNDNLSTGAADEPPTSLSAARARLRLVD